LKKGSGLLSLCNRIKLNRS